MTGARRRLKNPSCASAPVAHAATTTPMPAHNFHDREIKRCLSSRLRPTLAATTASARQAFVFPLSCFVFCLWPFVWCLRESYPPPIPPLRAQQTNEQHEHDWHVPEISFLDSGDAA